MENSIPEENDFFRLVLAMLLWMLVLLPGNWYLDLDHRPYPTTNTKGKKSFSLATTISRMKNTIPAENDFFGAMWKMLLGISVLGTLECQGLDG